MRQTQSLVGESRLYAVRLKTKSSRLEVESDAPLTTETRTERMVSVPTEQLGVRAHHFVCAVPTSRHSSCPRLDPLRISESDS